jgi:hypothetical protein
MIIVKPKIVGDLHPQDMTRNANNSSEMMEVLDDMFIRLRNTGGDAAKGSNLEIMQGDIKIRD